MESADLRIFRTVAREGSITKAALQLGYVQSNVTARVQQLESELGTVLFYRHNRGMTLSSSGKALLAYADKIVGLLDEATKALSSLSEPSGPLIIGSTQTAAAVRLPKLLASYYEQNPRVQLSLTTGHSEFLMENVLQYVMDGAFIGCKCTHPDLQSIPAFQEELVIVSAPTIATLEMALKRPILVFSSGCSYRDVLNQWLSTTGLTQPTIMEFGTLEAILGGVTAGLGISLMPRSIVNKAELEGTIRTHSIPAPYTHMTTEFITRKDSFISSALQALMTMITE
ncbi:putative HTH-type transcriptional regulator YusT [Paenibacillus baekrokdamisoli]|uniref:Putative HTH-type transcriptional regulator YusT n=1 Tax=Paenibacillus baekrokdamisoli TaxID=1712516 RepID=A0A3G9J3Y4_9BACL|nr:LysR family transcriptional regulator [Paenibacillus baekrokdamisoli]MBB3072442.1 DNA-binding transcriptional LysR family regulator [Paenibacillus baekrokdamisoli]BBH20501.1 putative HTH-type transcriptional regulator YusT [Paenibacillus baekrokdamisoli]